MVAAARTDALPSSSIADTLRQGVDLFGQDRLIEAEFYFTAALARDQGNFDALQLLTIVRMRQGRTAEALDLVERALRQRRRSPQALALLGMLLSDLGRCDEALATFDTVLAIHPGHAEMLYNRGVALAKLGREGEALESYGAALRARPDHAMALYNLANTLARLKDFEKALAAYDLLLARIPANAEVLNNRGNVLFELARYEDALADYDTAIAAKGDFVDLWLNRGKSLRALGRRLEAVENYDRLLVIAPDHAEALGNRGIELLALDRPQEALASFEAVLAAAPDDVGAHVNSSAALQRLGRFDDALASADLAIAIDPNDAQAHFARGNALQSLNGYEHAVDCYQASLAHAPGVANVHKNLGDALHVLGRHEEALFEFGQALALGADHDETRASESLVYLSLGRFAEGWQHYDCRLADKSIVCRPYPQPRWDGSDVAGTLLVWGEQGRGDQILYASMVPDLLERVSSVVLEVEQRLVPLFARSFPNACVIALGSELYAGDVQAHAPIASLGRHLRPDWDSFPCRKDGFLKPDPERARVLRKRLNDGRTVVGLSWKSPNPKFEKAAGARLRDFESVLRVPGCRFVDLQDADTLAEREAVERDFGVRVERLGNIDNTNDIDGLAGLIAACDLVVTASNTTAHLAGAVGCPTVVFAPYGHARLWYWFKDRADSPWYPHVRVLRQAAGEPWANFIASANLSALIG